MRLGKTRSNLIFFSTKFLYVKKKLYLCTRFLKTITNNMKTRLLKKLRKEAKRYIHLYPCGFEESYNQRFSHDTTQVEIHVACENKLMEKYMTYRCYYAKIDGVEFTSTIFDLSLGWCGECRLDEAKKILRKLRREYILQKVERLRDDRLFNNNKKEYENFKKYIASL